jgi:hypothetical protein
MGCRYIADLRPPALAAAQKVEKIGMPGVGIRTIKLALARSCRPTDNLLVGRAH